MNDRYATFLDSDNHLTCIKMRDIRNITYAYDNFYLVVFDTPTKKRNWDTIMVTAEQARGLADSLNVIAWSPKH